LFRILTIPLQVDSAKVYGNELESAAAIRASGLDRSQIFYTSKVPSKSMGYEKAKKAIEESIAAANLGYIDLYGPPCSQESNAD
jgi:Aldo/keto reductases, related to diketogulonate reductase